MVPTPLWDMVCVKSKKCKAMLKKIEYLIPAALQAIDTHLVGNYQDKIPEGYQGAVAGFGSSLLQMGLLPTLAVYCDKDNKSSIDRPTFLKVLKFIITHADSRFSAKHMIDDKQLLLHSAIQEGFPKDEFKEQLLQASLAFKLAIRTYKLVK